MDGARILETSADETCTIDCTKVKEDSCKYEERARSCCVYVDQGWGVEKVGVCLSWTAACKQNCYFCMDEAGCTEETFGN